jgi:dTDP-4-amino-4,6-dideoxygalactose transaminase
MAKMQTAIQNVPSVPLLDVNRGNHALRDELVAALTDVVDSGKFLHGPQVAELETQLARLCNTKHAIGCASGSDALVLALMALELEPGDEVILPSFTFFATASCVDRLGAKIVFADINPQTYNIDPTSIEANITNRTRAIIPVHLFGQPAEIDVICKIAARRDIPVIEDAAQAIGSAYHGRPIGSWGQMGCLSFYPTKNLGGLGDGGMLTTNSDSLNDRLRLLATHGMKPRYYHSAVGINSRLDTLQAAALLVKTKRLDAYTLARHGNASRYSTMFEQSGLSQKIGLPFQDPAAFHVWNQYSLRVGEGRRDALKAYLQQNGVGCEIYYPVPLHKQQCFQGKICSQANLPETDRAAKEILHIPVYPELTSSEQHRVVDVIDQYYREAYHKAVA